MPNTKNTRLFLFEVRYWSDGITSFEPADVY